MRIIVVFKMVLESFAELYVLAPYTKLYTSLVIPFKIKSPYKSDKIIVLLKDLKVFSFLLFYFLMNQLILNYKNYYQF